jgi:hypothetical protein
MAYTFGEEIMSIMNQPISVSLSAEQAEFIRSLVAEAHGGSAKEYLRILNHSRGELDAAAEEFESALVTSSDHIRISETAWRILYDAINAAIYALGPFELSTITGFSLREAAETNLRICSSVWGAYGGASWLDTHTKSTEQE